MSYRQWQDAVSKSRFLEAFALGRSRGLLAGIASAFGQEPILIPRMVAKDDAGCGDVEYGYSCAVNGGGRQSISIKIHMQVSPDIVNVEFS